MVARWIGCAGIVTAFGLVAAAPAASAATYAVDAEMKRAQATPSWTHAKFVGSVTFTCTPDSTCGSLQTSLYVSPTSFGEGADCDSNFKLVWESAPQTASGTQSFSLPRVPIQTEKGIGMYPQHWCFQYWLTPPGCVFLFCQPVEVFRQGDLKGRSPCKGKPKKNRFAQASAQLNVRQYRKKHCPRR